MSAVMAKEKPNRKRISVQLFPKEEWLLPKLHILAEAKSIPFRDVVVRLVKEEVERNAAIIAKGERFKAEAGKGAP